MSEKNFWRTIKNNADKCLKSHDFDITRHEDTTGKGVPDVSGCIDGDSFWAELKYLKFFPKRESTIVRIEHYTQPQKDWLYNRGEAGGNAWLLVKIDNEVFIFGHHTAQIVGAVTRERLLDVCKCHWVNHVDWDDLFYIIAAESSHDLYKLAEKKV